MSRQRLQQGLFPVLAALFCAAVSCVGIDDDFTCSEDAACIRNGEAGRCAARHCMFADSSCEASGWRFDEHSGTVGGECAECGSGEDSICPGGDDPGDAMPAAGFGVVPMQFRYAHDDTTTGCGAAGEADLFADVVLTEPGVLYADVPPGAAVTLALRAGSCTEADEHAGELRCERANCLQASTQIVEHLDAGTYCVVAESGAAQVPLRYAVVAAEAPLPQAAQPAPVDGDTCGAGAFVPAPCGQADPQTPERIHPITACETPMVLIADLIAPRADTEFAPMASVRGGPQEIGPTCFLAGGSDEDESLALPGEAPIVVALEAPSIYWMVVEGTAPGACGSYRFAYVLQVPEP